MTYVSAEHQECLLACWLAEGGLYGPATRIYCQGVRIWCVGWIRHYMGWNNHLELGLTSSGQFLLSMAFDTPCEIIQCLASHLQQVLLCWSFMLISLYLGVTLGITDLKAYLSHQFHTKDLSTLRYFLRIEVARSKTRMYLSERKYALDLLQRHEC